MKCIKYLICVVLLLFSAIDTSAQLSFQVDSIHITTINDFPSDYLSRVKFNSTYDKILNYGPLISVFGHLCNDTNGSVTISAYGSDMTAYIDTEFEISFIYKGTKYKSIYSPSINSFDVIKHSRSLSDEQIDGNVQNYLVPAHSKLSMEIDSYFLEGSKWYKVKMENAYSENFHHNVLNNKKMARIAQKVLPSVMVDVIIKKYNCL